MCGIAGFRLPRNDAHGAGQSLLRALSRRGPDGGWVASHDGWQLIQTRLAVIDLSSRVRYPMVNESESIRLLFNGEVYNHPDLRAELTRLGHVFATDCDAEVVLHGWEEWGEGILPRLNGMWAFALAEEGRDLVLARDRLGIKPLVHTDSGPFAFASDAVALVEAGLNPGHFDRPAIEEYLALQYVPAPLTGIEGVTQVEPGSLVRVSRRGAVSRARWAPRPFAESIQANGDPAENRDPVSLAEADATVRTAVVRQLAADVDVGIFLSGGLDSTLVLHYAAEAGWSPTAFTIGFSGHGDYDESARARAAARHYGVRHVVTDLEPDFETTVAELAAAYDSPFADASAIATLAVARLAREHVTVALSGTGGDDLFGGYYRHRAYRFDRALSCAPRALLRPLARRSPKRGAERRSLLRLGDSYAVRLARIGLLDQRDRYMSLIGSSTGAAGTTAMAWPVDLGAARSRVANRLGFGPDCDVGLNEIQAFELRSYLPGDLLVKEDRATMRYGLEGRVPLLDDNVLAIALRTTVSQRASLRKGKILLRRLAAQRLPSEFQGGAKRGFAVPLSAYLAGSWREALADWSSASASELVDGRRLRTVITDAHATAIDKWSLIALIAWERRVTAARRTAGAR